MKKRKGREIGAEGEDFEATQLTRAKTHVKSMIRSHFSLEDCLRSKFREGIHVGNGNFDDNDGICSTRRVFGAATVPPCVVVSLPEVELGRSRGLKRKIGCIDVATQMGRKNRIEDDYVMVEAIGKGKFGSVWLCRSRVSGEEYACKTLRKGEESVHREVEIMQHLSGHQGIVMLKAVYEDTECYHLVMEFCSGGQLIDRMRKEGRYSERQAANLMKDLMLVIKYCHEMGVVHRDIKPENILLTSSGKMKLADFGLAVRVAQGQGLNGLAGSPSYMAPEVISGAYSEKVDIWSAGVLLYALLTGGLPFHGSSVETILDAVKNVKLDFHSEMWQAISKPARNLMGRMMSRDVSSRISADEVLGDPWIIFHTEHLFRPFSTKSKAKPRSVAPHEQVTGNSHGDASRVTISKNSSVPYPSSTACVTSSTEGNGTCDLLEALTAAISQVSISERKRTRLCVETTPLQQQFSANSLCKAF